MPNRNALKREPKWIKIVRKMKMRGKREGDAEGLKLLKRKRTRLAASPPALMKVMMVLEKRRRNGPEIRLMMQSKQLLMKHPLKRKRRGEMSQLKRLSLACVVCATPKEALMRKKHLLGRRKRSEEMVKKAFQLRLH